MKAIVFDFDGTLTKSPKGSNCWYKVWEEIDDLEIDNLYYGMRKRNEINDDEWLNLIVKRYIKKGVNLKICQKVSGKIKLQDDLDKTFEILKEKGILVFILSGGIKPIVKLSLNKFVSYIESIEAYDFDFDKKGKLKSFFKPFHNLEAKEEYIEYIKKKHNLSKGEILFVGNGQNDETVYKSGVKTLCINPDDADYKNKKYWTNYIQKCGSLLEILPFVSEVKNADQDIEK